MTTIERTVEFSKDAKKLSKKYPSFIKDLALFETALKGSRAYITDKRVLQLGRKYARFKVFKVRSFRCRSLGGGSRSGIRVIYYDNEIDDHIVLIEVYCKNTKENEDRKRITDFLNLLLTCQ